MNKLEFNTYIKAPVSRCFDLARSIDFHKISVKQIKEESIAGCTTGLIGPGQHVLLHSRMLGITVFTELKITKFTPPYFFSYEMVSRLFSRIIHDYYFYEIDQETVMVNQYYFETRFGLFGKLLDLLVFKNYIEKLIQNRNALLAHYAETEKWKEVLNAEREKSIVC
jgi:hypothetical protein